MYWYYVYIHVYIGSIAVAVVQVLSFPIGHYVAGSPARPFSPC